MATLALTLVASFLVLYPLSSILHLVFLRSTGRPLKHVLCRDTIVFEIIVVLETQWFIFFLKAPID